MTSDGETLYFAAMSEEGLGGYDIYVTRFDSDEGTFLEAENVGLPYNSFSDDSLFCMTIFIILHGLLPLAINLKAKRVSTPSKHRAHVSTIR